MGVLWAYVDESGVGNDPTPAGYVFASAGFIAPAEDWERFSVEWRALLLAEGLPDPPELHMKHLLHSQGDFKGWDAAQKERVLGSLVDSINRAATFGHGCVMARGSERDWEGTHAGHIMASYYQPGGFLHCIGALAGRSVGFLGDVDEKVRFVCGRSEQWGPSILSLYEEAKKAEDFDFRHRLGDIRFESPRRFPPLQAADLLAYETRRKYIDSKDASKTAFRRSLIRLESGGRITYCNPHTPETLEPAVTKVVNDPGYQAEVEKRAKQQAKRGRRTRRKA